MDMFSFFLDISWHEYLIKCHKHQKISSITTYYTVYFVLLGYKFPCHVKQKDVFFLVGCESWSWGMKHQSHVTRGNHCNAHLCVWPCLCERCLTENTTAQFLCLLKQIEPHNKEKNVSTSYTCRPAVWWYAASSYQPDHTDPPLRAHKIWVHIWHCSGRNPLRSMAYCSSGLMVRQKEMKKKTSMFLQPQWHSFFYNDEACIFVFQQNHFILVLGDFFLLLFFLFFFF